MRYEAAFASLVLLTSLNAPASCVPPPACYDLNGVVAQCSEERVESRRFLRVTFTEPEVIIASCGTGESLPESSPEVELFRREALEQPQYFLDVRSHVSCSSLVGSGLEAGVEFLCCDTVPAQGLCKSGQLYLVQKSK